MTTEFIYVRRLRNADKCRELIFHPSVYPAIKDDRFPIDPPEFIPVDSPATHYSISTGRDVIGIASFYEIEPGVAMFHPIILPMYRKGLLPIKAVKLALHHAPSGCRVMCEIPEIFRNVHLFALQCGFKDVGFDPDSFLKNGEWFGSYVMELAA